MFVGSYFEEHLSLSFLQHPVEKKSQHIVFSDEVDKCLTMVQHGIDSLMVAEIKQVLYRNFQIDVILERIYELTFAELLLMEKIVDNTIPLCEPQLFKQSVGILE